MTTVRQVKVTRKCGKKCFHDFFAIYLSVIFRFCVILGVMEANISRNCIWDFQLLLKIKLSTLSHTPRTQLLAFQINTSFNSHLFELIMSSPFLFSSTSHCCVQVEQYGSLIFHGLEGSCQENVANLVARCIKVPPRADENPVHRGEKHGGGLEEGRTGGRGGTSTAPSAPHVHLAWSAGEIASPGDL